MEEILNRVFKWHKFPVNLNAEAVFLYFRTFLKSDKRAFAQLD